jgi:hypothetical protein
MQMFTIRSIRKTCSWVNGIEAYLDAPTLDPGAPPRCFLTLSGWVAAAHEPIKEIWLTCVGKKLASAKVFPRPDVAKAYPGKKHVLGFELVVFPLSLGSSEPLKLMMETANGKRTAIFEVELQFADTEPTAAPTTDIQFAPIIALPRSGTTYFSQLLHTSDVVLGDDQYPYELRLAEHFANDWLVNVQPWAYTPPADRRPETIDPNFSTICNILRASVAPTNATPRGDGVKQVLEASRRYYLDKIIQLYRLAAPKPKGYVIAEKIGLGVELELLGGLGAPVRPMFLIRDPRDILLSMRSFNEKRAIYEFHEPRTKHFFEVVQLTSLDLLYLTRLYERWPGDKLLIRYDELISEPQKTLRRALAFLGTDPGAVDAASLVNQTPVIPGVHITSSSAQESIGRWKDELTPSEIAMANWHFEPFLQRFGF